MTEFESAAPRVPDSEGVNGACTVVASVTKPFPPAPLGSEVRADAEGFLPVSPKGIAEDFAQDLPKRQLNFKLNQGV